MPIIRYASELELDHAVHFAMYMHKGQANAIPRWELVRRIYGEECVTAETQDDDNLYERSVRNSLERWRAKGHHFCNMGHGEGYYVANDREEYEAFKRYYLGAALRKLQVTSAMDEMADERWGRVPRKASPLQVGMFGG